MNINKRIERDQKIVEFMTTPIKIDPKTGRKVYPSLFEGAVRFNLSPQTIFRIKKSLMGLDKDWKKDKEGDPSNA